MKTELCKYLVSKAPPPLNRNDKGEKLSQDEAEERVERHLQDLFWRLVALRAQPHNMRMSVLVSLPDTENTRLLCKGKYHCATDLLFD